MKNLIFLVLIILIGVVGYMYFFGKGEDRERAAEVVSETKDLARSVGDFIKKQKDKYDDGEFDRMFRRINNAIEKARKNKDEQADDVNDNLRELEKELKKIDPDKLNEENKARLKKLLEELEAELQETQ